MLFGDNRTREMRAGTLTATKHGEKIQRAEEWGHQKEKSESQMRMHTCGLAKRHWWTYLQGRNRNTDTEYSLVDTAAEGEGGTSWERERPVHTPVCRADAPWATLPHRAGAPAWSSLAAWEARAGAGAAAGAGAVPEEGDTCLRVVGSHFHIAETNATLKHSYIPISNKAKQK